ncbi:hypothetical protein UFOVP136_10 [uncultured Caudovirales phage]|uniref:Uncharacterized protein n=1 Tax=uncultured Caudovirales phage TaxID=2100421 RepID=A0A6J5LBX4_9CAUD|nr:hypothetical protein UFOVP136_10 [uncultured Caudovirales phage]
MKKVKVGQDLKSIGHKYGHCAIDEPARQRKIRRVFLGSVMVIYAALVIASFFIWGMK